MSRLANAVDGGSGDRLADPELEDWNGDGLRVRNKR